MNTYTTTTTLIPPTETTLIPPADKAGIRRLLRGKKATVRVAGTSFYAFTTHKEILELAKLFDDEDSDVMLSLCRSDWDHMVTVDIER